MSENTHGGARNGPAWSREDDDFLRAHWGVIPSSEIARRLGRPSKNSVVGRAHRLHLPQLIASPHQFRPPDWQPQRKRRKSPPRTIPTPPKHTLAAITAATCAIAAKPFTGHAKRLRPPTMGGRALPPATAPATAPRVVSQALPPLFHTCQWPEGDPRDAGFRFCDAPIAPEDLGRPYCRTHMRKAYVARRELEMAA